MDVTISLKLLGKLRNLVQTPYCPDLHHPKADRHHSELCPVEERINKILREVDELIQSHSIK